MMYRCVRDKSGRVSLLVSPPLFYMVKIVLSLVNAITRPHPQPGSPMAATAEVCGSL